MKKIVFLISLFFISVDASALNQTQDNKGAPYFAVVSDGPENHSMTNRISKNAKEERVTEGMNGIGTVKYNYRVTLDCSLHLTIDDRANIEKEVSDILSSRGILSNLFESLDLKIQVDEKANIIGLDSKNSELKKSLRHILIGQKLSVSKMDTYSICLNISTNLSL